MSVLPKVAKHRASDYVRSWLCLAHKHKITRSVLAEYKQQLATTLAINVTLTLNLVFGDTTITTNDKDLLSQCDD